MKIIGIGTTAVDYFFNVSTPFLKKNRLAPEDDVTFKSKNLTPKDIFSVSKPISKSPGGMSTNTIAVLSQLGVKSFYYGNLGKGENSQFWLKFLKKVKTEKILRIGDTHLCFCLLSNKGRQRAFVYEENIHEQDFFNNIDFKFLNSASHIHITPHYLDKPENTLQNIKNILDKVEIPTISFTPGIFYINFGLEKIKPILKHVSILFLNKNEIKKLTGKTEKIGSKSLLSYGPKIVICTQGSKGALVTSAKEQFIKKSKPVKNIIDSTGAGDAFAAGFLFGYLNKKSLEWSANFGNKIAAKSLSDYGLNWLSKLKV